MEPQETKEPDPKDFALPADPTVAVIDEYEAFSVWMNVQLSQLVARWEHLAAPKARKLDKQVFGRRFSVPRKAK